jgi:hypothetical protein
LPYRSRARTSSSHSWLTESNGRHARGGKTRSGRLATSLRSDRRQARLRPAGSSRRGGATGSVSILAADHDRPTPARRLAATSWREDRLLPAGKAHGAHAAHRARCIRGRVLPGWLATLGRWRPARCSHSPPRGWPRRHPRELAGEIASARASKLPACIGGAAGTTDFTAHIASFAHVDMRPR